MADGRDIEDALAGAGEFETLSNGVRMHDMPQGAGESPAHGQRVTVHYTGWLWQDGARGRKFDSSVDRGAPFTFKLGAGEVIAGWDTGVATMRIGGRRLLILPPAMAYGPRGAGGVIPPNATLLFEVELLGID